VPQHSSRENTFQPGKEEWSYITGFPGGLDRENSQKNIKIGILDLTLSIQSVGLKSKNKIIEDPE